MSCSFAESLHKPRVVSFCVRSSIYSSQTVQLASLEASLTYHMLRTSMLSRCSDVPFNNSSCPHVQRRPTTNQNQKRQRRLHERHDLAHHGTGWVEMGLYESDFMSRLKQTTRLTIPSPRLRQPKKQQTNKQRTRLKGPQPRRSRLQRRRKRRRYTSLSQY